MPYLLQYLDTIVSTNVLEHTVSKEALSLRWQQQCAIYPEVAGIIDGILHPDGSCAVSRGDIFACKNPFEKVIKILWWGYPNGMRRFFPLVIANSPQIAETVSPFLNRHLNLEEFHLLYNALAGFRGIGATTIGKLLYFFGIWQGETRCVIIDRFVLAAMGRFNDFHLNHLGSGAARYLALVQQINGTMLPDASPDQIEYFLFNY